MTGRCALSLRDVSKRYPILSSSVELKSAALHPLRTLRLGGRKRFWAVREIDLEVERGEFFAIVGANGSGKSTLLRLMAGLSQPTEGRVEADGAISSLLELGSGFHPQATGRENVIVNGLLMGMTRDEIAALLPGIVAFSGLREFIDQPMRTYSSGMYVRLGFAIAAALEPEILLVDEVLAVGDAAFQERCYDHIDGLRRTGATIVMVSHDLGAVERFASRAALMEQGRFVRVGEPAAVVKEHVERLANSSPEIRRALDDAMHSRKKEMDELLANDPEARARFDRALAQNPEFVALMDGKRREGEADVAED
jgi:ABC-type polysaccharide/polyol phosphate transport system ATPase subunit